MFFHVKPPWYIIHKIILTSCLSKKDVVVEIGCGEAWLSKAIIDIVNTLYVYEIDPKFMEIAHERLHGYDNVTYVLGDVLKTGFHRIKEDNYKIIANIPYYISAKIIKLIIENRNSISKAVIMVQKEFADKLCAKPGSKVYTSFTLYSHFYLEAKQLFKVSKSCFRPVPKVDSCVVEFVPRKEALFKVEEDVFFSIIRSAFSTRRKKLINCLAKSPYLELKPGFKDIAFFENNELVRGEELGLKEFYELYTQLLPFLISDRTKD
ncbi:16S rRNA (adenine(1518)-N(6)/adenine(1519)-N(6))-dimethyltransferase RsmA [Candidatus Margulisiibacteriota bacterium]